MTYGIAAASLAEARARAADIALEQTVEIPADIVPEGYIAETIVGRIEALEPDADTETNAGNGGRFRATLSYSPDSIGGELPQLLNVIFGNSSLQPGLKVVGFRLGETLSRQFPGAAFGITGLRALVKRPRGGLIAAVIKPQGATAESLAAIAYRCALAGADIIKEDHGLANQPSAPFQARCEQIGRAVARANAETGGASLYFANLNGPHETLMEQARFARTAGAGGLLVMPGLLGFDLLRRLSQDPEIQLPLMAHPSLLGSHVLSSDSGFSHGVLFGAIMRLAGADISIFPNIGGRFSFSRADCLDIAEQCRDTDGIGRPILPSPGGGMSVERAAEMHAMYGEDVVYLLGGSLLRHGERIGGAIQAMRQALEAAISRESKAPD
ncbi:2,3-diketo-5-methylthiopentyl-1-phosphate enolase [Thiorhodovibrio winogradskyi]|uniref:2,3-diketo-5-methylthiopentyl-1-phosphate enolase n=1 Tax=Thiorhodovibrio winogradskyi TaxID=77007 RepID=A0ABZ0S7W4_9GAMM|nr:RuBisCO large subunit C-terminal-like domain-containing protein [Thiorhodovibrio winogradskyi]